MATEVKIRKRKGLLRDEEWVRKRARHLHEERKDVEDSSEVTPNVFSKKNSNMFIFVWGEGVRKNSILAWIFIT